MARMNYQDVLDVRDFYTVADKLDKLDVFGILDILNEPDIYVIEYELDLAVKSYEMHRNLYPTYIA